MPEMTPRRNSTGSSPIAAASSSTKPSAKNALCEWPTDRQKPTGTPLRVVGVDGLELIVEPAPAGDGGPTEA